MVQIEVYRSIEELERIRGEWETLATGCPHANLFTSPEFICVWCRHFGAEVQLRVIAVRDKDKKLIGLAPMMIKQTRYGGMAVRMLSLLHNRHVSRSSVLVLPGQEAKVFQAITDQWGAMRPEWDVLRMVDVPSQSGVLLQVRSALERTRMTVYPIETSRTLRGLTVSKSWKEHVASCSKKFRANLRLYANRVQRRPDIRVEVHRGLEVRRSMKAMFDLQNRSWKVQDEQIYLDSRDQAFSNDWAEQMARAGGLENWLMYAGERLIGALHTLVYRHVQYFMLMFYEQDSADVAPGRYLFGRALEGAFESGRINYVDFNGDSDFVKVWATDAVEHSAISVCHQGLYSRIISGLKRIKRFSIGGVKVRSEAQLTEST